MITGESNRWIFEFQGDYVSLDSDNDVTNFDQLGELKLKMTILEGAIGYRFPLFKRAALDVLIGVRYTEMENTFDAAGGNTFESDKDLVDPILMLRPWIPITKWLSFNTTLAIGGGGDSDLVYELAPTLHFYFTDHISLIVGYRQLYYDIPGDNDKFEFDV